ncbi:MAG: DUF4384 domain-containing protein [Gemmatimonadales bacterium]
MISALLAALVVTASPAPAPTGQDDPPIRVSLNADGQFWRGDRAKVRVRLDQDGHLVVLRADTDGRVRVLFPLDPGDDDFVRGGRELELRGRGDREAFFVDDRSGVGVVLAARSTQPFRFERFVRGDHWDYRVLVSDRLRDDPEAALLDLVTDMADSARFDYDVARYTVDGGADRYYRSYHPRNRIRIGLVFGSRYRCGYYDPFYDPYYCDPFFYDPFYRYDPFYYRRYDPFYYRPIGYSCYRDPFCSYRYRSYDYRRVRQGGGLQFKQPRLPYPFVLPRERVPTTTATGFDRRDPPGRPAQPNVEERRRGTPDVSREPQKRSSGRERSGWTAKRPERDRPRATNPRGAESTRSRVAPRSGSGSSSSSRAQPSNVSRRRP